MFKKVSFLVLIVSVSAALASTAFGQAAATGVTPPQPIAATQTPSPERAPRRPIRRVPSTPARVTVMPSESPVAPQVVTIVHRLSGMKLLRLLSRQAGANGVVEDIDPRTLMSDAHASIIAGWVMDDGKTIAARLPQAAAEIETSQFEMGLPRLPPAAPDAMGFSFVQRLEPDLTVITFDGKRFRGRLVGLDAETGLSVLQIAGGLPATAGPAAPKMMPGQSIDIFAPVPVTPEGAAASRNTIVRLEKLNATLSDLVKSNAGMLETLTVRADKLSPSLV